MPGIPSAHPLLGRGMPAGAHRDESRGMLLGAAGVTIFSLTLPMTRIAVRELDPVFITLGRALAAALLATCWLLWKRARLPQRGAWRPLAIVAAGCIVGFPLFSSLALRHVPAAHGAVVGGILPLATAVCSALRGGERPSAGFWACAVLGAALVAGFALREGAGRLQPADLLMLAAVASAALGYAEGGKLARTLGGEATICWALVLAVPVLFPALCWYAAFHSTGAASAGVPAWLAFGYTCAFSMFLGFFFWYRGLALGGVARVGQVQLLQPFLSLLGAAAVAGEALRPVQFAFALGVLAVVAAGRRTQVRR
jgi:drug/metabolite transporter (DMT)-like permease